jgi:transcriptional regulator
MTSPVPAPFRPRTDQDVLALVTEHPLAWVISSAMSALLLPLRPVTDSSNKLIGFAGHFPRSSPQLEELMEQPQGMALFSGPSAYISPSWMRNRAQAPTWASASASFRCEFSFTESPDELRSGLNDLVDAMELGRPNPWRLEEVGARYDRLARGIISFRATILSQRVAFRLGQNEDGETFEDVLTGLRGEAKESIVSLMEEFRPRPTD